MSMSIRWTKEHPKEDGYYWWRNTENFVRIVLLSNECITDTLRGDGLSSAAWKNIVGGEFAGPITPPINKVVKP